MNWEKLGKIFSPSGVHPHLLTHAANPLPVKLNDDGLYRIYFSGRNAENRSSVGYFDFDMKSLSVVKECSEPLLTFGEDDSFYSHGISIGNVYEDNDGRHILFMGWQVRGQDHWRGDIGKINIIDPDNLVIESEIPFMSVDDVDPISLSYPWVEPNGLGAYDMWYGSTVTWEAENKEMIHVLNHAHSEDAKSWTKTGLSIPFELNLAQAFSRPVYWQDGVRDHMLFSYRSGTGEKYRIGYATREAHAKWCLALNEVGIDIGEHGSWDSEMICYPYVFEYSGEKYMLYNGNGFGLTGIGLAKMKRDN